MHTVMVSYFDQNDGRHKVGVLINWMDTQPVVVHDGRAYVLPDNDLVRIDGLSIARWRRQESP